MPSDTGTPYLLPFPTEADPPDVPKDIQALAQKIHSRLSIIDSTASGYGTRITNSEAEITKLNTLTKTPAIAANSATAYIKAASNFQIRTAYIVRWGYLCFIDTTIRTLIDRGAGTTGSVTVDMATWVTTQRPTGTIAYPLSSVDGLMAQGWASSASLRLQSLEAAGKWAKNTDIRFAAVYFTTVARTSP